MSIVDLVCAEGASGGVICAHIAQYYPTIVGSPIIYYLLDSAELPAEHTITQSPSDTGDDCHHEVDATNKALYKAFKDKRDWHHFTVCENGASRPMTEADVASLG